MKINFNRQQISEAILPLMCAISGKSTVTATEGILLNAKEDGTCEMTTFDLEKGMRITVTAEVLEGGSAIINAQKFLQTLRVMDGATVTLEINDTLGVCISSGKSNHKMNALAADLFPAIPRLVTEDGFVIGQAVLKEILSEVAFAIAANDPRPVLNGCFFRVSEGELTAVSCDSFKLAKCVVSTDIENKNEDASALQFSFILPGKTVAELSKLLKDDERETVRIYMTRKNIVFHFGDKIFFSRLIEGLYIEFERLISSAHNIFVTADRADLIAALERAALVTEEKIAGSVRSHVRLEISGDLMKIYTSSSAGSTYDEVAIEHQGGDITISFNNRFLIDSLRATSADRVKISLTSSLTSINIEPAAPSEGKSELFMLLPVRMKE